MDKNITADLSWKQCCFTSNVGQFRQALKAIKAEHLMVVKQLFYQYSH